MKQSDLAHLRRLLGWVRCEIGQSPEELRAAVRSIAAAAGMPPPGPGAQQRMVDSYDKARSVPQYVRAAVKALERTVGTVGPVVDLQARERRRIARGGPPP